MSLLNNLTKILREAVYHRTFKEDENLPRIAIWKISSESGGNSLKNR